MKKTIIRSIVLIGLFVMALAVVSCGKKPNPEPNPSDPGTTSYTITYELNGGTLADNAPKSYDGNSSVALPTPTKAGNNFDAWYDNPEFTGAAITAIKKGDSGNKTFYAKWIADVSSYTPKWSFNSLGFDGQGMDIVIKVLPVSEFDPFDSGYTGSHQEIKKKQLKLINAAYNVNVKYSAWDNEAPWGPERVNFIKTSFADGTFQKNNVYIINIASQWVPTLVKAGALAELYSAASATGIFSQVQFGGTTYEQNSTVSETLSVKKKVYGYYNGPARPDYFLYYNATLAAQCGMDDPAELWFKGEWTWSKFDAWVKQAQTNLAAGQYAIDCSYAPFSIGAVSAQGNKMANTSNGAVMMAKSSVSSVFDSMKQYYQSGYWDKGHGVQDVAQNFLNGNNIFHTGSLWFLKDNTRFNPETIEFEIGVVPYPTADSGNVITPITSPYTYYDSEGNRVKVEEPLVTRTGATLTTDDGKPIYGVDLSNSTYQVPFTGCGNYSFMKYDNMANGLTVDVLFSILHDIEGGLGDDPSDEVKLTSDEGYRIYLEKKLDQEIYVNVVMSVQDESLSYYEVMETLSMTVGGGSHFGPNAFWPLASGIMTKEDTPLTVLKSVENIYKTAMEELGY